MSRRLRNRPDKRDTALELAKTGWPPGMLQDDDKGLSQWLASRPDARMRVRERCAEIEAERQIDITEPESRVSGPAPIN